MAPRRYRRFRTQATVPYGASPERLIEFRDGVLELIRQHPGARQEKYEVALEDLENSGVKVMVQVFLDVADHRAELMAREGLILDIIRLADRLGMAPLAAARAQ